MKEKNNKRMAIILGTVFSVIFIVAVAGLLVFVYKPAPTAPIVQIKSPSHGDQISIGEVVAVNSISQDDKYNIARVELWETRGEIYRMVGMRETGMEASNYTFTQGWQPKEEGVYRLTVRAYNDQDHYGQAAVDVSVSASDQSAEEEQPDKDEESVFVPVGDSFEGSTLPDPIEADGTYQSPPSEEDPATMLNMDLVFGSLIGNVSDIFVGPLFAPPIPIVVEALDFEVYQEYDEVYCYVTLEDEPTMTVPESGSFDTSGDLHWNIRYHLGGMNSVVVMMQQVDLLDMEVECMGRKDGVNNVFFLGRVEAHHPSEDWDGHVIQQSASGGEGFIISYRINPPDASMNRPYALLDIRINERKMLMWQWDGDESLIDGFRLYRNGNLVSIVAPDKRSRPITEWWIEPPCGEEYGYYVVAFHNDLESSPSNTKRYQGNICEGADIIEVNSKGETICGGSGYSFDVEYFHTYYPWSIDDTYLGIRFFRGEEQINDIHSSHPFMRRGGGSATIMTAYEGTEPITTDKMVVYMFDENGQFFSKRYETSYQWGPGEPDLVISGASIDQETDSLNIWVSNRGCGTAEATDISIVRDDGWRGFITVPELRGVTGQWVRTPILPEQKAAWGGGAELTVDPLNAVAESNEENNSYKLSSARIKAVQFYQVYIYDDHDSDTYRSNPGEMEVWLHVRKIHNGETMDCGAIQREYHWHEGMHALGNAIIPVSLAEDDYLRVRSWIIEEDAGQIRFDSTDYGGWVLNYFSTDGIPNPDASPYYKHKGSWKGGGEYKEHSDQNDYKMYYRIILE